LLRYLISRKDAEAQSYYIVVLFVNLGYLTVATQLQKIAPIAAVILLCRGSAQKIVAESGTTVLGKTGVALLKTGDKFTFIVRKTKLWAL
jgi:hypothetical protein